MSTKHTPKRFCVICRQRFHKRELLRHVAVAPRDLATDPSQTAPGRGVYCCRSIVCIQQFKRYQGWRKKVKRVLL